MKKTIWRRKCYRNDWWLFVSWSRENVMFSNLVVLTICSYYNVKLWRDGYRLWRAQMTSPFSRPGLLPQYTTASPILLSLSNNGRSCFYFVFSRGIIKFSKGIKKNIMVFTLSYLGDKVMCGTLTLTRKSWCVKSQKLICINRKKLQNPPDAFVQQRKNRSPNCRAIRRIVRVSH